MEDTPDIDHAGIDQSLAYELEHDEELVRLKEECGRVLGELQQHAQMMNPNVNVNAQPNPWPTLLRMMFDIPGAPLAGMRVEFERQVWREFLASMQAESEQAKEAIARMRLLAPQPGFGVPGGGPAGNKRPLGVVHDGRVTRQRP